MQKYVPSDTPRIRPFRGMLLDDEGVLTDQHYHMSSARRLGRVIYGTGVIRGLEVRRSEKKGLRVVVSAGCAIDEQGRLLELRQGEELDLTPWTEPTEYGAEPAETWLWISISYGERQTRPAAVYLADLDPCQRSSEPSRVEEGVVLTVTDEQPLPGSTVPVAGCDARAGSSPNGAVASPLSTLADVRIVRDKDGVLTLEMGTFKPERIYTVETARSELDELKQRVSELEQKD
jgi:hypothetical protein